MAASEFEVAVIGGGIVGLATARALALRGVRVAVLEAEGRLAAHQTGHNSGVIHSGLYYKPGSLKAATCVDGRDALYRFCEDNGLPHDRCGKLVLAVDETELPRLDELERRGRANGLEGLRRLRDGEIAEFEPHARGVAALWVPHTGIVDYGAVAETMAAHVRERGGEVRTGFRVRRVSAGHAGVQVLGGPAGEVAARRLVNCAGLQSDRVARLCGLRPDLRIVPFRGEYYALRPGRESLVRNLIYPVPDPAFPFLGVHFTRMIHGGVEAGPNAVFAFRREGYTRWSISPRDLADAFGFPGFWRLARRHWRMGAAEFRRSLSPRRFIASLRRLVPEIRDDDAAPHGAGVRAQAVRADGSLIDDFHILDAPDQVHVLNAPSPAATASLAIGEAVADRAARAWGLPG